MKKPRLLDLYGYTQDEFDGSLEIGINKKLGSAGKSRSGVDMHIVFATTKMKLANSLAAASAKRYFQKKKFMREIEERSLDEKHGSLGLGLYIARGIQRSRRVIRSPVRRDQNDSCNEIAPQL